MCAHPMSVVRPIRGSRKGFKHLRPFIGDEWAVKYRAIVWTLIIQSRFTLNLPQAPGPSSRSEAMKRYAFAAALMTIGIDFQE